ncbi:MAG: polysaccharide biosynthesis tyrosine autokinase [Anaerolineales bacterium]|nr:polysaccharide biosynthesis tyrosine autokinase [Anaerolineales bacterium]
MELRHYLSIAWKWAWLIALSVIIAATSSYFASKATTPLYSTKTTLMIGRVTEVTDPTSLDLWTSQQLAYTYTQLARREPVLQGALDSLGLEMSWQALAGQVSANIVNQTMLMEISVVDSNPYRAKVLADAIARQLIEQSPSAANARDPEEEAFIQAQLADLKTKIEDAQEESANLQQELDAANSARQIQDLQNQISVLETKISNWQYSYSQLLLSVQGSAINALSIVEEASLPTWPISPNVRMNVLLASAIGLALAVGGAFLIEYLDDTIKGADDVKRTTNLPLLGAIARIEGPSYPDKLISVKHPLSPIVEAYRVLRTNLQFSSVDKPAQTLVMTSPSPSEGKSVTLANLAVVMAQSGLKVILVDTDLRRPVQHKIFALPNRYGFSDAILHANPGVAEHLQDTGIENLRLLSSGSLPPNPAELLASERMKGLVEELKTLADVVLFDSPPTLVVADAAILGTCVDGVLVVNDAGRTRTTELRRAVDELRRVHANMLGIVLNRLSLGRGGYYYYYYYTTDGDKKRRKHRRNWLTRRLPDLEKVQKGWQALVERFAGGRNN